MGMSTRPWLGLRGFAAVALAVLTGLACPAAHAECTAQNTVTADIVAIEQAYLLNRFGAFVPSGMMFALRRDVVSNDGGPELKPGQVHLDPSKRP
ncbi:MAG: hypothetical protein JWQ11_1980, partial [Rhizobacter sp.]|nr:hypothetical protein [Rhizobacter sp.]